jgi:hypothetical protein
VQAFDGAFRFCKVGDIISILSQPSPPSTPPPFSAPPPDPGRPAYLHDFELRPNEQAHLPPELMGEQCGSCLEAVLLDGGTNLRVRVEGRANRGVGGLGRSLRHLSLRCARQNNPPQARHFPPSRGRNGLRHAAHVNGRLTTRIVAQSHRSMANIAEQFARRAAERRVAERGQSDRHQRWRGGRRRGDSRRSRIEESGQLKWSSRLRKNESDSAVITKIAQRVLSRCGKPV